MKAGTYISNQNYITDILELKDNNIQFFDKFNFKSKLQKNVRIVH
jgi:hypothetical protein